MKKMNVLVFPCGSEIGLEIYESVAYSTHFKLYGASSVDDHGMYVYENYIPGLPQVGDNGFIDSINRIIKENNIDFIFPAHDSVVLRLSESAEKGELGCTVVTSVYDTCLIARSKKMTYDKLGTIIDVPKLYDNSKITDDMFPVFMKPDVGQGSKGVHIAENIDDVDFYFKKDPTLLTMEYLPGPEYTIDCFTDYKGKLRYVSGRVRQRISNGISVSAATVEDDRFGQIAEQINNALKFNGVWFFQVKENTEGNLVLLEIAPRIAGTMGHDRVRGVNLALLSLFNAAEIDVDIYLEGRVVFTDRALKALYKHDVKYEHVYIDFDDLILMNGHVSPRIIAFLYQCINRQAAVHLLTKHTLDIHETLVKYRLGQLFDTVTKIEPEDNKYKYITHKDAIFIDDSFAERKEVYEKCGIPTFDMHSIDLLIEKL